MRANATYLKRKDVIEKADWNELSQKNIDILKQFPFLGDFLAYQVMLDVGYYDK